jgi:CRISPR-associated protein Cas2
MLYLATYDIERNSLRTQIAKLLENSGLDRIQFSVFVGVLTRSQQIALQKKVRKLFENQENANFMLLLLEQRAFFDSAHVGDKPPDWSYLKGEKDVLIF